MHPFTGSVLRGEDNPVRLHQGVRGRPVPPGRQACAVLSGWCHTAGGVSRLRARLHPSQRGGGV